MKSVVVYKIHSQDVKTVRDELQDEELLKMFRFTECSQAQKQTAGFSKTFSGKYVHKNKHGDLVLVYTTQNKTINKNEVASKAAELLEKHIENLGLTKEQFEMIKAENTEQYREIIKDVTADSAFEVLKTTFPNEAKNIYVVITEAGYVYVEGNWSGAEKALNAIRSAIGTFPAVPVQYDTDSTELMRKMVVEKYSEEITLGEKIILETPDKGKVTFAAESAYDERIRNMVLNDNCKVLAIELEYDGCITSLVRENLTFNSFGYDASLEVLDDEEQEQEEAIQVETLFLLQFNKVRQFHEEFRKLLKETKITEASEEEDGDE